MAITQKGTATEHGITFGYSDYFNTLYTAGDLTVSELIRFSWCASEEPYTNALAVTNTNVANQQGAAFTQRVSYVQRSLSQSDYDYKFGYVNERLNTAKPYSFMILVYAPSNSDYSSFVINSDSASKYRLVTDIDIQKLYLRVNSVDENNQSYTKPTAGTVKQYQPDSYERLYSLNDNGEMHIYPMTVYVYDENNFFISQQACGAGYYPFITGGPRKGSFYSESISYIPDQNAWYADMTYRMTYGALSNYQKNSWLLRWAGNDIDDFLSEAMPTNADTYCYYEYSADVGMMFFRPSGLQTNIYWYQFIKSEDAIYKLLALNGLKCKFDSGDHQNDTLRPIISNTLVTGYTFDPDETSEFDDLTNVTGNNISPSPPSPPGPTPGPYDDDPWSGATFAGTGVGGAGAFAKCYYMTSTELANLRSWMNSINVPEGFDPMQQIIGLSQVPVTLSGDAPENVVFVNSSAVYDPGVTTRAVDTGVSTQQAMGTPISYYLGSVDIVRRMQERGEPYLDYDCQIELYLPLIGMFSLDTQAVMGRTISAYAVLDPVSGTLAAYAYVTKDGQNLPVAYGSTSIGVDLPISAQQLSVSRAALKQANAQLGASLLSGALTMLAAASSGGKSSGSGAKTSTGSSGLSAAGIREAGSDYMKASQVGNVFGDFMQWGRTIRQLSYGNNTAVAGSFGGSTAQWSYPFTPYVKIIRPRYEKPSNYAHSQGVPCVQTKPIGSCTGFIQCIGADVSGITGATDLELQAIQAALSNGIYAGGGS